MGGEHVTVEHRGDVAAMLLDHGYRLSNDFNLLRSHISVGKLGIAYWQCSNFNSED
jgi:hypothetical protein